MRRPLRSLSYAAGLSLATLAAPVSAQDIVVRADQPQHVFEGAGASFGLFLNNYRAASEDAQDAVVRLIAEDLDLTVIQDYTGPPNGPGVYPEDDPVYFDRRAAFVQDVRAVRPGVEFSVVTNKFPDALRRDAVLTGRDGVVRTYRILDTENPDVYAGLADWYFQVFQAYDARGVSAEILNVVNEPDLEVCGNDIYACRPFQYGYDGDTERGVAEIFAQAVPLFKAKFADPEQNPTGMPVPRIMGPSTLSPVGALRYVRYFKEDLPAAWDQVDIVATHQYENGVRGDLFQQLRAEADGRTIHQSETHGSKQYGPASLRSGHRTALSFARLFGASVNFGTSMWSYFQTHYPNPADPDDPARFNPGGLLSLSPPSIAQPEPMKQYYAFRQLTSAQPDSSAVLPASRSDNGPQAELVAFRKGLQDTVYVSFTNTSAQPRSITIQVEDDGRARPLAAYALRVTDALLNDEVDDSADLPRGTTLLAYDVAPYSVSTFVLALDPFSVAAADPADRAPLQLDPAAPNPASGQVTLGFSLPQAGPASLVVRDVLGREVAVAAQGERSAGAHRVPLDVSRWAPGLYVYTLRAAGQTRTGRLTVAR